ncbi:lysine-specific demethylase JMJ16 [Olea europaea subsp. europaea]|uniref:Lysine-specific demethylase JMJ16 n=3 Tax=Olea europaea subsp. europaea TaxID=158383 RepID=A0A8S0THH6_OLEEU|nr:lysine-specific demethylase JMJ16 [Olea europaea subsp. europaea]
MGTELFGPCVKEENMEISSIPPGFESLVPFTLKRVEDNKISSYCASADTSGTQTVQIETEFESSDDLKFMKSLRRRPWINYSQFDNNSGNESDSEQNIPLMSSLPKGVIRGCEECSNCQKVTANWHPEEACRPDVQEAPVFYPTEEEFGDTLKYIASIRSKAETYGICRIVPPPSWKPPCPLKEKNTWETSKFSTRIQRIDKLQNRNSVRKILQTNYQKRRKRRCVKTGNDHGVGNEEIGVPGEVEVYEAERFGFEPGPEFTLDAFQKYADDFKAQYFSKNNNSLDMGGNTTMLKEQWQPSVENIEGEYWRMVEKPTEEIEVLYGADLETGEFGSGFPKYSHQAGSSSDIKYVNSGWNLNNLPRLPGSVLSFESSDISGVLVPWLYLGMCFSSFCWHVEDHHLYSLNYMHWGASKIWYGVPGSDALKLEEAMRKHLPDLFDEQPDLLHKLVTQLSPSILISEEVPVYRCVQNPGEFVLTFPRAYHAGFNCGFNCAEAVNVAPVDWLPHGQNAIELYCEQGRKTSISHDKLLLGAAREAVKAIWELNLLRKHNANNLRWKDACGKDGILSKALKTRVEMERVRRECLCSSSQALKMESSFDANSERECNVCQFDLHLSASGCHHCSPDKYACLKHAKQLCSCSWGAKFFLFRYDINELNILVEALEGKLSAVYRWAKLDLGLVLSSHVSKEKSKVPGHTGKMSYTAERMAPKEMKVISKTCSLQKEKPSGELLALEKMKASSTSFKSSLKVEAEKHSFPGEKEDCVPSAPMIETPVSLLSQVNMSSTENLGSGRAEEKQTSFPGNNDLICLSDDEGDESSTKPSVGKGASEKHTGHIQRQAGPGDTVGMRNDIEHSSLTTTISASVSCELMNESSGSEAIKVENHIEGGRHQRLCSPNDSIHGSSFTGVNDNKHIESCPIEKETVEFNKKNADFCLKPQCYNDENPNKEDGQKRLELDLNPRPMENVQSGPCNPSGCQNNLDRYYRQKGPRIAKVVRRINCNVEALDFGVINAGKLWCDSRAIYPKGFRSRVRYIDALDPSNMCYYVSEILDAGRDEPLFMVSVEYCPSEVFVHVSAVKCWEMVRDRVNQEITKQHKLGKVKLPPLQPPGSLDGMEMFGFSSPAIVQEIQAMDKNRVCTDYWKSRPLMQIPQHSHSRDNCSDFTLKSEPLNDQEAGRSHPFLSGEVNAILNGLFKKANPEELQALYSILKNNIPTNDQSLVTKLVNEEIHRRQDD